MMASNRKRKAPTECEIFSNCCIYILPSAIGQKRLALLETQIKKYGGQVLSTVKDKLLDPTHIVVDDTYLANSSTCLTVIEKVGFNLNNISAKIVGTQWLSKCIKDKEIIETNDYELPIPPASRQNTSLGNEVASESEQSSFTELPLSNSVGVVSPTKVFSPNIEKFVCSQASGSSSRGQLNSSITGELQKLADAFRSSGDRWRTLGYDKAISTIKAYPKQITSIQDVESLPGIGKKMAAKVCEILESGKLRKVDEICGQERTKAVELFTKIWGVGPATAESWYQQGLRTLDDVQAKGNLTKQQAIGLKHFNEFQERIPRDEAGKIGDQVMLTARALDPSVTCLVGGSYRRGKPTCGDIDVLIARDVDASQFLSQLISKLKNDGLITDDLVTLEAKGKQKKWLGVCRWPGVDTHRRLDIFVVPRSEFAPAVMHYTGSALFNRSIRLLAARKGMSLSEHCLTGGIVRQGKEILNNGYVIPTPTEESIFEALGLQFRPPQERDH